MLWNPTSNVISPLDQVLFGGRHNIYVMDSRYDEGAAIQRIMLDTLNSAVGPYQGVAGPVTAMAMIISPYWAFLYLLLLPLGWARIYLAKHDLYQVVAGSVMSIVITFIIVSSII